MRYRPALDGLRALCALAVILHHASYGGLRGGFLGVDIFFVLSGFLITSLLDAERDKTGTVHLGAFYLRRAGRLLPAAFAGCGLGALVWWAVDRPGPIAPAVVSIVLYYANFKAITDVLSLGPLGHMWSLSIEEQFYVAWPLSLLALRRRFDARGALGLVVALVVALSGLRAFMHLRGSPVASYFSTVARMDSMLVGCALALFPAAFEDVHARFVKATRRFAPAAALIFVGLFAVAATNQAWLYLGGFTAIALLAGVLIVHGASDEPTLLRRGLSWGPLTWLGRRSYGLYVYHLPIIVALEPLRRPHDVVNFALVTALRVGVTIGVAAVSFRWLEQPLLARTRRGPGGAPGPTSAGTSRTA